MSDDGYDSMDAEYEKLNRRYQELAQQEATWEPPDWNAQPTPELVEEYRQKPVFTYGGVPEQKAVPEQFRSMVFGDGYEVKSSGQKVFPSGAVRDSATDKPRYDLIDPGFLHRFAEHMRKGAQHYGDHNWTKGIPSSNYMQSLLRHIEAYRRGERDEDHLAAAAFNIMGLMRNEGTELDDLFNWNQS